MAKNVTQHRNNQFSTFATLFLCAASALAQGLDVEAEIRAGDLAYNENDIVGATKHYRRAADTGSAEAQAKLAFVYDWSEQNEEAVQYFRASADQGHPEGQVGLAEMYAKGEGVARDLDMAVELFMMAAVNGNAQAQRMLASAYETGGLGRDVDAAEALRWLLLAANNNDASSIRRLVQVYREGELGATPDPELSQAWQDKLDSLAGD